LLRLLAAFLIAAMMLPAIALISATARNSCCCKSAGACPLRKHMGCEKSCSMSGRDAAPASRAPNFVREPAVFLAAESGFEPTSSELAADFSAAPIYRTFPPTLPPPRA